MVRSLSPVSPFICSLPSVQAGRQGGRTTFMEHCRGLRHRQLYYLVQIKTAIKRRDGPLMSEEEATECLMRLKGISMMAVLECSTSFSVGEFFQLERACRSFLEDVPLEDESNARKIHLF